MSNAVMIDEETFGRIEQALNLAIGMASLHSKDSVPELVSLAGHLTDLWNDADYGDG